MVLIFSIENDTSTNKVVKKLLLEGVNFIRINRLSDFYKTEIEIDSYFTNILYDQVNLKKEISSVWYRREPINDLEIGSGSNEFKKDANIILLNEIITLKKFCYEILKTKYWLSHPNTANLNELVVLQKASEVGLQIPKTAVIANKLKLKEFFKSNNADIISKPAFEVRRLNENGIKYTSRTSCVSEKIINQINDDFFPSLVQCQILKKFEVRTVFLENTFYSMAIMSQRDEKTKTDFRFYNLDFPNRYCAFQLPEEIEYKLKRLMEVLKLNFGSIDLVVDNYDNFVFLEVNPVGQFGMTSTPNNFGIEDHIVEIFRNNLQEHRIVKPRFFFIS